MILRRYYDMIESGILVIASIPDFYAVCEALADL